jgi:hypothetical protein
MSTSYNGFVYQWTNTQNGKKYIGSHYGSETDYYIGSGIYFRRAYKKNPSVFQREILEYVNGQPTDLLEREQYYLDQVEDIVTNTNYYNCSPNAKGGWNHGHLSVEKRQEIIRKAVDASLEARRNMTDEERETLKIKKQQTWQTKQPKHISHSEKTKQRRLIEEEKKTQDEKLEFREKMKKVYWDRSQDNISKHTKSIAEGVKKWHATKSPEKEKARMDKVRETKQLLDLRWMYHPGSLIRIQVPFAEIPLKEQEGWKKGMGPKR